MIDEPRHIGADGQAVEAIEPGDETNVTALFGVASMPCAHIPGDVLEFTEDLLAQVHRGEIVAMAVAYVRPNRSTVRDWVSGTAPANLLLSGVARLQFSLLAAMAEEIEEPWSDPAA